MFGCSIKYLEHSSLCSYNSDNRSESTYRSHIVEGKFYVNKLSWLKVSCFNGCNFRGSYHIFCIAYFSWCLIKILRVVFW